MDIESQRKARLLALEEKRSKLDELRKLREDRNIISTASMAVSLPSLKTPLIAKEDDQEGTEFFFLSAVQLLFLVGVYHY